MPGCLRAEVVPDQARQAADVIRRVVHPLQDGRTEFEPDAGILEYPGGIQHRSQGSAGQAPVLLVVHRLQVNAGRIQPGGGCPGGGRRHIAVGVPHGEHTGPAGQLHHFQRVFQPRHRFRVAASHTLPPGGQRRLYHPGRVLVGNIFETFPGHAVGYLPVLAETAVQRAPRQGVGIYPAARVKMA